MSAKWLWTVLAMSISVKLTCSSSQRPAKDGEIAQKTEDLVGPYELHDFYLYYVLRFGFGPAKIFRLAKAAFAGRPEYPDEVLYKWLRNFYWRWHFRWSWRCAEQTGCPQRPARPRKRSG